MKTITLVFAMIALLSLNEAMGQWNTSGNNIYNSNTGYVGIGTTTPAYLLHVSKNMVAPSIRIQNAGGIGGASFEMIDNNSGADWKFKATNSGGFKIRDHANGMDVIQVEPNSSPNSFYINADGFIGLGTTTPGAKLDVNGRISQTGTGQSVFLGEGAGATDDLADRQNVFVGYYSGNLNSSGYFDVAVGSHSLENNQAGVANVALGSFALNACESADGNTGIGHDALKITTGGGNAALGYRAGFNNTEGYLNVAIGYQALLNNSMGYVNTALGHLALNNNLTGHENTGIGVNANVASSNLTNATAIGANAYVAQNNSMVLGSINGVNGASTSVNVGIGTTTPDASAVLDLSSTDKGFLLPRLTQVQIESIPTPADGLMAYCTTDNKLYIYIGLTGQWKEVPFSSGIITPPFSCNMPITINHVAGDVAPVNKTTTYGTVTGIAGETSKCWITHNLGADHQASAGDDATEASAGWYWQFNRMQGFKHDGANRTPNTTWITTIDENSDWLAANDPCEIELGNGWRIPTFTEWSNVFAASGWSDVYDAYSSGLKLHTSGDLNYVIGSLANRGVYGKFWSSSQNGSANAGLLVTGTGWAGLGSNDLKAFGYSVRCVKD